MVVNTLKIQNFMMIEDAEFHWSPNINIICGENSTGKTTLLKLLYSMVQPIGKHGFEFDRKDEIERRFVSKMLGVFRPDDQKLGRLVSRRQGSNRADFSAEFEQVGSLAIGFGNRQENHADINMDFSNWYKLQKKRFNTIYIPTKEMISTTEHFASLYEEYELDFEEMYYDLTKLLSRPLSKGPNTNEQKKILKSFEEIMQGEIIQKNKKFYLKVQGQGEFEMGLVSDGYRKLSMIIYLILSGSLNKESILFWDEPETNMNPKMIRPIVKSIVELAKMGVQVFVTTHDYFVLQEFNMLTAYPELNEEHLDLRFYSLYKEENGSLCSEVQASASDLTHNAIMEEFDALYDREQEVIYGSK